MKECVKTVIEIARWRSLLEPPSSWSNSHKRYEPKLTIEISHSPLRTIEPISFMKEKKDLDKLSSTLESLQTLFEEIWIEVEDFRTMSDLSSANTFQFG